MAGTQKDKKMATPQGQLITKPKIGRPLKWESVTEVQERIRGYIKETPMDLWTWTGLCVYLGTTRETLSDYEKKPEFSDSLKAAKQLIEHAYELRLIARGNAGDIFALKNFGWKDKQEVEQTGEQKLTIEVVQYGQNET